jgi:DNA invertase Pin-like site-specific DNA recombinase
MLHIYAAVAEKERGYIAERTRAALQAAKARGIRLGNRELAERNRQTAAAQAESPRDVVVPLACTRAIAQGSQ